MDDEPLVAVRIKDGIFIGNAVAAHDEDFLYMNKVTHVVNCAGAEVPNLYGGAGVEYITFGFRDAAAASGATTAAGTMFDSQDKNVEQVMRFIDRALENGECVMVHCIDGSSRSCAMLAGYFIVKYGWKVNNTLSFLQMAHQDMEIADPWLRQLKMFGKRHAVEHDVYDVEVDDNVFALDNDQWMLRNTLLNGLSAHVQEGSALFRECAAQIQLGDPVYKPPARRRRRLVFVDTHQGTSVASSRTTPVLKTDSGKGRHADPHDMSHHSGIDGITELLKRGPALRRQRTEDNAILARYSTPHRRRLESTGDTNAKGRQHLTLRRRTPSGAPTSEVRRVPSVGASPAGTRLPASNAPIVRTSSAGGQQGLRPQQYDDEGHRSFHPQPSSTTTTTTRQADPINRTTSQPQQYNHPSSTVHSRQQSMVSEAESQRPLSHNSGGSLVGDSRHMAPTPRPAYGAPQYRNNINPSVPQSSVGPRTPFALSSTSKPRVGSPLPQQRRVGSSSTVGNGSMQPQLHTARKTSLTGPSVPSQGGSIYNSSGMRPASPAQRTNTRPSSPTVRTQQSGFESSLVRRASSPLQQGLQPNVPIRRGASPVGRPHIGGGATVVHGASGAASSGTIQPTIRRANSPLQRSSLSGASQSAAGRSYDPSSSSSGIQRPTYSAQPANSTINRSSVGSRPSSPMQRGLMPATSQPARPSSPNHQSGSSSLADQYLRGGTSTGLASGGVGGGLAAGGIRRGSSPMQRR